MKEAFRNSSIIGNPIDCSTDLRASNSRQSTKPLEKANKYSAQNSSSNSLSKLFSDEEERDLLGIGFFTVWEAGLLLSGYGGTGIVLSRNILTGEWSGPVAVMVSGVGAGVLLGASVKTVVYLIYDYFTLQSISGTDGGIIFGAGAAATVGTWTTEPGKQSSYITSPKMMRTVGIGNNVALCRGLAGVYGAMSVEAGICKCRDKINARFYGREDISGSNILLSGDTIDIPDNSKTAYGKTGVSNFQAKRLLEKIQSKLVRLCDREGSDHGSMPFGSSSNNKKLGDSENNKPEDVRATLEELYADKSYDKDESEHAEIKEMQIEIPPLGKESTLEIETISAH